MTGSSAWEAALIDRYDGHPLALKLVAETVESLYFGDVDAFLDEETVIFADIRDVLDQHFARLSPLEQELMIWLAIVREPISVQALGDYLLGPNTRREYLEALRALQGRSLLERQSNGFTLQNVITEYTTSHFINQVCQELEQDVLATFNRYPFILAQTKAHVRESQRRLIVEPITQRLVDTMGQAKLERTQHQYLDRLRAEMPKGYAGGNILNWLLHLKRDLAHMDFSGIAVWQAYLQGMNVRDIDFSRADLSGANFTQTFGTVSAVAYSPDGRQIVSGGSDKIVRVWDAQRSQELHQLRGHSEWVWSVAFSPDGNQIVSGGSDGIIRVWDATNEQELHQLKGHAAFVWSVAFSPDGERVVSSSYDQTIRLWNAQNGQEIRQLQGHTDMVRCVAFSPDGRQIVSASADHTARIWQVDSGQELHQLHGHREGLFWFFTL